MCGIAGMVSPDGVDPRVLMEMTHLVSYRGPSGFGFAYAPQSECAALEVVHDENRLPELMAKGLRPVVGLGSRRLAILDVSRAGNMPMAIEGGDYSITFNGEIYNYGEIRCELQEHGHQFHTGTDTEVILRAYQRWGPECLRRFNGMWSFALLDRRKRVLFCSRDRFGVKPFYYSLANGTFFFASEIKQVLQASAMPRVANSHTVYNFLQWGLLDSSADTFFDGIYQLPGGHSLVLDLAAPLAPKVSRYWELRVEPEHEMNVDAATEEFKARFRNAVKLRLRSDVPVGICLSGGLDSSAIICQANEIAPEIQFQTFSACFDNKAIDERDYIAAIVSAVGAVSHQTFPQGRSFWEKIQSIAFYHDEPIGSTSAFAQWCVMSEAQEAGTPVVLGGQGGDEILCGYQKYRYFYLWHLLRHRDPKLFRECMHFARGTSTHWTAASISRYFPNAFRRPFSLLSRVATDEFRKGALPLASHLGAGPSIAERQKTDLIYSSIPALLRHEDRNSMAHSVESRLPFLDYQLAEFAVNCAPSLKLRDGWTKWILRNAMARTMPEKVRLRKTKLGFDTPEADWMRLGLQNGHRQIWDTPKLRMERFLDARSLAAECRDFLRGAVGALPAHSIFRAISLEMWAQVYSVS
jgi:asparagine synthase (glutamine-hydrolysing)